MGKRIDGFKAALEMLQKLDLSRQQELIADIARQDPEMAIKLKKSMVTFDDLLYLTSSMMRTLLKEITPEVFGLALRGANLQLTNHLFSLVSQNNKKDMEDILKGKPRSINEVMEAQNKIMEVVMRLRETGEIILSKEGSEKLV